MNTYVTGNTIRKVRENRNLTQVQLGEQIGVSGKTVSKWETGKGLPEVSLMMPLCETLNITVNELLSGERIPEEIEKELAFYRL